MKLNEISGSVVDASIAIHRALGPGLLEQVYLRCLEFELRSRGLQVCTEVELPVVYAQTRLDVGYRIDLIVEDRVIVELKSVERLTALHKAQLLTYLKLTNKSLGLLINFNSLRVCDAIVRLRL